MSLASAAVRQENTTRQLLWVDDRVSIHGALIKQFSLCGVEVSPVETLAEARETLMTRAFDVVLLDAMLGHESSLNNIPELSELAGGAKLNICSGMMYQHHLQEQRKQAEAATGSHIGTIDKLELPDPEDSGAIHVFLERVFDEREDWNDREQEITLEGAASLSYSDYDELSLEERLHWIESIEDELEEVATKHFKEGNVFLLFAGSLEKPVLSIQERKDIPPQSEILRFAESLGFAPIAVHDVGLVDDVSSEPDRSGMEGYPVLGVKPQDCDREDLHLDSGASNSLMSYEWFVEKGWVPYLEAPSLIRAGEMRLKGSLFVLDNCAFIDSAETAIEGNFDAFYIMKWKGTRLATASNPDGSGFRSGLLGRNVPRDTLGVRVSIDFSDGSVVFVS